MAARLAIAAVVAATAVTASVIPLPRVDADDGKIVGGEAAALGDFPYIVSLSLGGSHFCGGSLLDSTTVLTAAHCSDVAAGSVQVRAGTLNWATGGKQVGVAQIYVHPNYVDPSLGSDIAIWKLSTPIDEEEFIKYAHLPAANYDPPAGDLLDVAGWGYLQQGSGQVSDTLQKVEVPVVARDVCQQQYTGYTISTDMFCAGEVGGGQDSCQGDSGGPIVDKAGTLVGAVSWGIGCALADYSGVYTNIGPLLDFVNEHVTPGHTCGI